MSSDMLHQETRGFFYPADCFVHRSVKRLHGGAEFDDVAAAARIARLCDHIYAKSSSAIADLVTRDGFKLVAEGVRNQSACLLVPNHAAPSILPVSGLLHAFVKTCLIRCSGRGGPLNGRVQQAHTVVRCRFRKQRHLDSSHHRAFPALAADSAAPFCALAARRSGLLCAAPAPARPRARAEARGTVSACYFIMRSLKISMIMLIFAQFSHGLCLCGAAPAARRGVAERGGGPREPHAVPGQCLAPAARPAALACAALPLRCKPCPPPDPAPLPRPLLRPAARPLRPMFCLAFEAAASPRASNASILFFFNGRPLGATPPGRTP